MNDIDPRARNRNRLVLLAIVGVFFGALALAGVLRFSGWRPAGMKNHGELLQPPADARAVSLLLADGSTYAWNPAARIWRIVLAPPNDCADACVRLSRELDTVWRTFGQNASQVQILWVGAPPPGIVRNAALRQLRPSAELRARLPRVDDPQGVPVYVIDPNGFVILRYAPGFKPADLRDDLSKLLRLM